MLEEIPAIEANTDPYYWNQLPKIGSKHIHKGGNIWQVTRFAFVWVKIELSSGETKTFDKGLCIFLRCTNSSNNKDIRWEFHQFHSDFQPF